MVSLKGPRQGGVCCSEMSSQRGEMIGFKVGAVCNDGNKLSNLGRGDISVTVSRGESRRLRGAWELRRFAPVSL